MKLCGKCGKNKPKEEFSFKNKARGTLQSYCKECQKAYRKAHYERNKEAYLEQKDKRKQDIISWYKNLKSYLSCSTCGEDHPATLQFHHTAPNSKLKEVSVMVYDGYSIEAIKQEIEKCVVLCANCHAKEHYED